MNAKPKEEERPSKAEVDKREKRAARARQTEALVVVAICNMRILAVTG